MSGFMDDLDDKVNKKAEADKEASDAGNYTPEAGELLRAVLTAASLFTGGQYAPSITISFRNIGEEAAGGIEPGGIGRMFLSTVLEGKFMESAPKIGSSFGLRFEGMLTSKAGNEYKAWTALFEADDDETKRDHRFWSQVKVPKSNYGNGEEAEDAGEAGDQKDWKF